MPAPIGTSVTAYSKSGQKCGGVEVKNIGMYGLLSCKGYDFSSPKNGGAKVGEPILFYVNGRIADVSKEVIWAEGGFLEVNLTSFENLNSLNQNSDGDNKVEQNKEDPLMTNQLINNQNPTEFAAPSDFGKKIEVFQTLFFVISITIISLIISLRKKF